MPISSMPLLAAVAAFPAANPPDAGLLGQQFLDVLTRTLGQLAIWFLVTQVLLILAFWIASNVVAHAQGRFTNALKLYFLYLFSFLGIAIVLGVVLGVAAQNQSRGVEFAGACVGGILVLVTLVGLPMKVYKTGPGGAIGFLLIALVLHVAGNLGAAQFLSAPVNVQELSQISQQISALPPAQKKRFFEALAGRTRDSDDELLAADRTKPIAERFAAVSRIYAQLEERHAKLPPGDEAANAAYARDEKHYEALLAKIQADAAAGADKPQEKPGLF